MDKCWGHFESSVSCWKVFLIFCPQDHTVYTSLCKHMKNRLPHYYSLFFYSLDSSRWFEVDELKWTKVMSLTTLHQSGFRKYMNQNPISNMTNLTSKLNWVETARYPCAAKKCLQLAEVTETPFSDYNSDIAEATRFALPLRLPHLSCTCGLESITGSSPSAKHAAMDCPCGVVIPNRLKWPIQWMGLRSGSNRVYWQLARV